MTGTIETTRNWHAHWKSSGRRGRAADDFYAQVERTVGGQPVPAEQLDLVAEAVRSALELDHCDALLDLCCGNGLLTVKLAPHCRAVFAVDYADELIEIACRYNGMKDIAYLNRAASELAPADFARLRPNKVCMNAGLQYFTVEMTSNLLKSLLPAIGSRAPLYFSDIPDAAKLFEFYDTPARRAEFEHRRIEGTEAIGTWWSRADLRRIFEDAGYRADFIDQDPRRFTASYRYDLLARPAV